jgi:hypothetical protein
MTRQEFFEWLETCPTHEWEVIMDEEGNTIVTFPHYEESED